MSAGPVRAMIAEDSPTARAALRAILGSDDGIEVAGEAANGREAVDLVARLRPSIVVMDIEMPVMDGFEATRRIMAENPTPIVIVTSHRDPRDVALSLRAVRVGALSLLPKPGAPGSARYEAEAARLVSLVKALAEVRVIRRRRDSAAPADVTPVARGREIRAVAVAASTGGPAALSRFLEALPPELGAPVLVVQHIARGFLPGMVAWLNGASPLPVSVARDGEPLRAGRVYVAPDEAHLEVAGTRFVRLTHGPEVGGFRPSATVLLRSMADAFGASGAAVVLTGMGTDGLEGARRMRQAGGTVLAQDEETAAVFGMPRAVAEAGLADAVGSVETLALRLARSIPMAVT